MKSTSKGNIALISKLGDNESHLITKILEPIEEPRDCLLNCNVIDVFLPVVPQLPRPFEIMDVLSIEFLELFHNVLCMDVKHTKTAHNNSLGFM